MTVAGSISRKMTFGTAACHLPTHGGLLPMTNVGVLPIAQLETRVHGLNTDENRYLAYNWTLIDGERSPTRAPKNEILYFTNSVRKFASLSRYALIFALLARFSVGGVGINEQWS
ncbi:hypothetical protein ICC18_15295 [Paenibacillus sp. WST5]|uniref:Uncharacterized protein n=1 Tax=Paenibacillus sedimenti TaxID=2770274 RepID=A0A926QKH6_9BACL|nr:hypothetical protein [Paenibacillus sedimenti]